MQHLFWIIWLVCFAGSWQLANAQTAENFKVEGIKVQYQWTRSGDSLKVILNAPTKGWIAGFNDKDQIVGTDLKMMCVRDGVGVIEDQYVQALGVHPLDEEVGIWMI